MLERIIAIFASDSLGSSEEKQAIVVQRLNSKASIVEVTIPEDLFLLHGFTVFKQELAFYMVGILQEQITIPVQLLD